MADNNTYSSGGDVAMLGTPQPSTTYGSSGNYASGPGQWSNPDGGYDSTLYNARPSQSSNTGKGIMKGLLGGGSGAAWAANPLLGIGVTLVSGLLGGLLSHEPKVQLTPEQEAFKTMTNFYGSVGKRYNIFRSLVASVGGQEVADKVMPAKKTIDFMKERGD